MKKDHGGAALGDFKDWVRQFDQIDESALSENQRKVFLLFVEFYPEAKLGRRHKTMFAYVIDPKLGPLTFDLPV